MGGYGSGRWHDRNTRQLVSRCLSIDPRNWQSQNVLRRGVYSAGELNWTNEKTGEQTSSLGWEADMNAAGGPILRLRYRVVKTGDDVNCGIDLVPTTLPSGGQRWWFICPLNVNGKTCGRRVRKLYLPPGGKYYGCRHCYRLTYRSCNESRMYDAMSRELGKKLRLNPNAIKRLFKDRW